MSSNGQGGGARASKFIDVQLRVPQIPGYSKEVLAGMAQAIMSEITFWAPLEHPQKLADVAGAVLGDVPLLEEIRAKMAKASPGEVVQMMITRPSLIQTDQAEVELVLNAHTRVDQASGDTSAMASFVTVVGLLTSPSARALLALAGRRVTFSDPFVPTEEPETIQ
jgi:hypothetical protein